MNGIRKTSHVRAERHGWFVLDKPAGLTSNAALQRVRSRFDGAKAGHAGTLDPFATGVLPIAFGHATRCVRHVIDQQKEYVATLRWGFETDTGDADGRPIDFVPSFPAETALRQIAAKFVGSILQIPPTFSALKIKGTRAYRLARRGVPIAPAARRVQIDHIELIDYRPSQTQSAPDRDAATECRSRMTSFSAGRAQLESDLRIVCGKGTYIRALARDLARALNARAHVSELRRTRVGPFCGAHSHPLPATGPACALADPAASAMHALLPIPAALPHLPCCHIAKPSIPALLQGQPVVIQAQQLPAVAATCEYTLPSSMRPATAHRGEGCPEVGEHGAESYAVSSNAWLGLGIVRNNRYFPRRVCHVEMPD